MLILSNIPGHIELMRVMTRRQVVGLMQRHPRLGYRYLLPYLARGVSRRARLRILTNHYRHLAERVNEDFLVRVYDESPVIWREKLQQHGCSVTMSFPKQFDLEGDLRLDFNCGTESLWMITCTIACASALGLGEGPALLITTVQGAAGKLGLIREITKVCHDTAPVYLLLAAAEGVALSLDVGTIAGMGLGQQFSKYRGTRNFFDYDRFWRALAAEAVHDGFYVAPVPLPARPLAELKSSRRGRALRRRELRNRISAQVQRCFEREFLKRRVVVDARA